MRQQLKINPKNDYISILSSKQQKEAIKDEDHFSDFHPNIQSSSKKIKQKIRFHYLLYLLVIIIFLTNIVAWMYKNNTKSYEYQIFNKQYSYQQLGSTKSIVHILNLTDIKDFDKNYFMQNGDKILLKSYVNQIIQPKINFSDLEQIFPNIIAHELFSFRFNSDIQTKQIRDRKFIKKISQETKQNLMKLKSKNQDLMENIALSQLLTHHNISDDKIYELQYIYADQKYQISQENQLPFCIFSEGSTIEPIHMEKYFKSLQNLNYQNFHVVYINEFQKNLSKSNSLKYIQDSNILIKNKIQIVNNLQSIGTLGNIYFMVRKFCNQQDIVLILGKDQYFPGRQALKILNSVYRSKDIWTISFNIFEKYLKKSLINEIDKQRYQKNSSKQNQEKTSYVRSFRKKLIDSIPLQVLIEYKYNNNTNQVWPVFYSSNINNFQSYFQFKKIDRAKTYNLNQFIISTHSPLSRCQKQEKDYQKQTFNLITPINFDIQLGKKAIIFKDFQASVKSLNQAKKFYQKLYFCKFKKLLQFQPESIYSYKLKKEIKIFKRRAYNQKYIGQLFGKQDEFNLTDYFTTPTRDDWISIRDGETKSIQDAMYILTPQDLNKLIGKFDFWKLKQQLQSKIPYQIWQFKFDDNLEKNLPKLQFTHLKTQAQLEEYLYVNLFKSRQNFNRGLEITYAFGNHMFYHPTKKQVLQTQLYHYNKKYNISSKTRQVPICVFTAERNIVTRNQYIQYFDSLQKLNYSNYKILYIDDMSSDGSAEQIYDLVDKRYKRIKNRMKIIHNLQGVSSLGNIYFWTQKFCDQNDVVVNIDADDALLGTQSFKVLSAMYEDENIWYVHSKSLIIYPNADRNNPGSYTGIPYNAYPFTTIKTSEYRRNHNFMTFHIRTFRLQLMKAVPLYQFIEFHYNKTTKIARPTFQSLAHDITQSYAHVELAGNQRLKFVSDYIYAYYGTAADRKCYATHEDFDHYKELIKTPLDKLQSIYDKGHQVQDKKIIYDNFYQKVTNYNKRLIKQNCYLKQKI